MTSEWRYKPWRQYREPNSWDKVGPLLEYAYQWMKFNKVPGVPTIERIERVESNEPHVGELYRYYKITAGYVERRRLLPHPQSKTSYQRIMKRIGKALQIVEGGPEGNCSYRAGGDVTISQQYHDAVLTLEKWRRKIERLENGESLG